MDAIPQRALCLDAERTMPKYALTEFAGSAPAAPTVHASACRPYE